MFCMKCGKEIEEGVLFCPECGVKQGRIEEVESEDDFLKRIGKPVEGEEERIRTDKWYNKLKSKKQWFVSIPFILALLLVGVFGELEILIFASIALTVLRFLMPYKKLLTVIMLIVVIGMTGLMNDINSQPQSSNVETDNNTPIQEQDSEIKPTVMKGDNISEEENYTVVYASEYRNVGDAVIDMIEYSDIDCFKMIPKDGTAAVVIFRVKPHLSNAVMGTFYDGINMGAFQGDVVLEMNTNEEYVNIEELDYVLNTDISLLPSAQFTIAYTLDDTDKFTPVQFVIEGALDDTHAFGKEFYFK